MHRKRARSPEREALQKDLAPPIRKSRRIVKHYVNHEEAYNDVVADAEAATTTRWVLF